MKKSICLILFLFALSTFCYATKYALVIGIGTYPKENGWSKINGDKDIPYVKEILSSNGFHTSNIKVLRNENATANAIRLELDSIIQKVTRGDVVYIHFSGHGQQVTDLNGDEDDEFDEAWIPFDARQEYQKGVYEGENHIIDDELNKYLTQLRSKVGEKGIITVVADACHSGGSSRAVDDTIIIRGTTTKFEVPRNTKYSKNEIKEVDWIFISACDSDQVNFEYKGKGSLTYALWSLNKDKSLSITSIKLVHETIKKSIKKYNSERGIYHPQIPIIEMPIGKYLKALF